MACSEQIRPLIRIRRPEGLQVGLLAQELRDRDRPLAEIPAVPIDYLERIEGIAHVTKFHYDLRQHCRPEDVGRSAEYRKHHGHE